MCEIWKLCRSISWANETLVVETNDLEETTIKTDQIDLIGEFTNEDGPFAEDHFFVVAFAASDVFYAPMDVVSDSLLRNLGTALGDDLSVRLHGSTSFRSRAIWPQNRSGQSFLEFHPDGIFKMKAGRIP